MQDPVQDRLVFLIGSPRSGSTLLSRLLGAHPALFAPEEPHLITPIAFLGYYASVDQAAYDPVIVRQAARHLVASLPGGEQTYLEALRAYPDAIYRALLGSEAARGSSLLLDKTPAYALCLDFLARLYPAARYIVLTRHPLAVWSSFVDSFFDGDDRVAHAHNPLLERYVPAIAGFLRRAPVPIHRVRYERLVQDPEEVARELCVFLRVEFEPGMVEYGSAPGARKASARGLGDPTQVAREVRPTTRSVSKWATAATGRPQRVGLFREILARLTDEDLETWGFSRAGIEAEIDQIDLAGKPPPRPRLTRYALERKLLVALRRGIRPDNAAGRLVRRLSEVCDVLVR
jgi:hypothetical protein